MASALQELQTRFGAEVLGDPRRCRALLSDVVGRPDRDHHRHIDAVALAVGLAREQRGNPVAQIDAIALSMLQSGVDSVETDWALRTVLGASSARVSSFDSDPVSEPSQPVGPGSSTPTISGDRGLAGTAAVDDPSGRRVRRARHRHRLLVVGAAVLVVAVASVLVVVVMSNDSKVASARCQSGIVRAPTSEFKVADGTVVTDGTKYGYVTAGALFQVSREATVGLGASQPPQQLSSADFDRIERRPRNEAVLREDGGGLYFSIGGALFPTTQRALDAFRPNAPAPITVPVGGLAQAPKSPRSGSLVEVDGNGNGVWLVRDGVRQIVPPDQLCRTPDIIRVPDSPGVLAEIPLRNAHVTTTTSQAATGVSTPPPLPDPGVGLVARACQREANRVVASGTLTNTAYRRLFFVVEVRLVAADGAQIATGSSGILDIASNGLANWRAEIVQPPNSARIDRCEYRVNQLGIRNGQPVAP